MGGRHEHTFLQRRHTNGQWTHEKCSTSLGIREMSTNQNHNEISFHTNQNGSNEQVRKRQMLARMWRKGNSLTVLVGMQAVRAATLENSVEVPQRVETRATLRLSNCRAGYFPQRYQCSDPKGCLHPNVYSSNVHKSQTMERAQMSTDR